MSLITDYEKLYNKYVSDRKDGYYDKINKPYKISGNLFSHFLRNEINKIIGSNYQVSPVNSFIKGCNVEWDLLILKKSLSREEEIYNIYSPKNVICAFEFKSSGAIMKKNPEFASNFIIKKNKEVKKIDKNINFGYISLCEIPDNQEKLKQRYSNCFWIIEGYYKDREKEGTVVTDRTDLEKFINSLLKKHI